MAIKPVKDMVAEAKTRIDQIPPAEAKRAAEAGEALLIDIRDVRELDREGRVPGAMHAPRGMLEFWIDPASPYHKETLGSAMDEGKTLILFCAAAARSSLAAATLKDMGVPKVAEVDGGFGAWRDAGLPVERRD